MELLDQPAVIIASASLAFPLHGSLIESKQQVYIATGKNTSPVSVRN